MNPGPRSGRMALITGTAAWLLIGLASAFGASHASAACEHRYAAPAKISTREAKRAAICVINHQRSRHGVPPVGASGELSHAARRHSRYIQKHRCFSHRCDGEAGLMKRVARSGYLAGARSAGCGEAIGWGKMTPKRMVKRWMASPAHRAILLDRDFKRIGIGTLWGTPWKPKANAAIYTADLCYRRG